MARDSQLAGDRVQTEYYLQFADHYFRVLGESRSRFEDQRRQRGDDLEDEGEEELAEADTESGADDRPQRHERHERGDRDDRFSRGDRPRRGDGEERAARDRAPEAEVETERMNGGETIPFDVLPPAIGREGAEESAQEEPRRPRRRTRANRPADGDDEIAPAA